MDLEKRLTGGYSSHASPNQTSVVNGDDHEKNAKNWPSIWFLLAVSVPRMATNMAWAAQWAAIGPYMQTMMPGFAVQLTQLSGPVVGIFVSPMIGIFSDRSVNRFGRRRPTLVISAVLSILCWIPMAYVTEIGDALGDVGTGAAGEVTDRTWTSTITILCYIWMDITVNCVQTPALLLIADHAGDRQTTGAAIAQGWSMIGALVVAAYIQAFGPAYNSMHWFMGMLSVFMVVCIGIACIVVKEEPLDRSTVPQLGFFEGIKDVCIEIYNGFRSLPKVLVVFYVVYFFIMYGNTAYSSNKAQFFGLEVYDGDAMYASTCGDTCTDEQKAYNKGVSLAGGLADILLNVFSCLVAYVVPLEVSKIGAKWAVTLACVPMALMMIVAFTKNVYFDVIIAVLSSVPNAQLNSLAMPIIIHLLQSDSNIGMQVGTINSVNCIGQILNFSIAASLVETSLGYKLPVFLGGACGFCAFAVSLFFLKIKMYSM
jgi:solute carrier family 45 protein 1/2/4